MKGYFERCKRINSREYFLLVTRLKVLIEISLQKQRHCVTRTEFLKECLQQDVPALPVFPVICLSELTCDMSEHHLKTDKKLKCWESSAANSKLSVMSGSQKYTSVASVTSCQHHHGYEQPTRHFEDFVFEHTSSSEHVNMKL